jgi:glutathione S-transferase
MTSLTLVRKIRARPSIIFKALTTPEGIVRWWGPDAGPVLVAETDMRIGGRFRVRFRVLDGSEHESTGEYLEIIESKRLVMSWQWTAGGERDEGGDISRVEIDLRPIQTGTERDLRVRWALEEAGLPYRSRLLEQGDQDKPDYRALQPFGQVPIFEEDGFVLFESGAIVLHIGERSATLLPKDAGARARATQWLIAALNSIEPYVMNVVVIDVFYAQEEWAKLRRPSAVEFVQRRLSALSGSLGDKRFLDGDRFTAGDLMMTTVLRMLGHTDLISGDKRLAAYVERCTARPAFKRALDAQLGDFKAAA